ncbi:TPA: long-chain fatty acid--CoA ligase [Pseudomonas putida]|nr:long-chain fatty acid--CoA ligase [Pseudomonas putida]
MEQMPWMRSYPADLCWDEKLPQISVLKLLDIATLRWPNRPAVDFMGCKITYRELSALVDRATVGLQQLGVGPGVQVGLYLPNVPHFLISFFAILRAGAVVVNYSPLDARTTLAHKIEDSETDVLITLDLASLYPNMQALLSSTRLRTLVVGSLNEFTTEPGKTRATMQKDGLLSDVTYGPTCIPFAQLMANDGRYLSSCPGSSVDTVAVLQYTGGTTGLPKGAMLTHGSITAAVAQVCSVHVDNDRLLHEGSERILVALPLFHVYAMITDMLLGIRIGAELVLMLRFDPEKVLQEISERKITCFPGVPTMFSALMAHPRVGDYDLKSLKVCGSGGAPLPIELLQRFEALAGCPLSEGWGMTETTAGGTFTPRQAAHRPGSCGLPMPGLAMKFVDINDPSSPVPLGASGELVVAGPNLLKGYWRNEQATLDSFTADGFFRTGDIGYMDEDGYIYIVDRTKDMLLCGGFNVYPRVIEEAIYAHPGVEEVIVIGIDDAYRGQAPMAFVKLRPGQGSLSLDQLREFLRDRLGKHEMIHALEIRDELPKTAVGKLSKLMLRDEVRDRSGAGA